MLSNIIQTGDKIKLTEIQGEENTKKEASYISRVVEVMDPNSIRAVMPTVNGKSVILDSLLSYNLELMTQNGTFQCEAKIVRRFKEKFNFFVVFEMMSELEKIQRREYYRLECILKMEYRRSMEGDVYAKDEDSEPAYAVNEETGEELVFIKQQVPWHAAVATNISGGGIRFNSRQALTKGENVLLKMHLKFDDGEGDYEIPAKVVHSVEVPNRPNIFETRVQFTNITAQDRENIIRFVFDEERRIRRRKKGLV